MFNRLEVGEDAERGNLRDSPEESERMLVQGCEGFFQLMGRVRDGNYGRTGGHLEYRLRTVDEIKCGNESEGMASKSDSKEFVSLDRDTGPVLLQYLLNYIDPSSVGLSEEVQPDEIAGWFNADVGMANVTGGAVRAVYLSKGRAIGKKGGFFVSSGEAAYHRWAARSQGDSDKMRALLTLK